MPQHFYVCNEKGKVMQIRKQIGDRYLIEYCRHLHDHAFEYVSKEEFNSIPSGMKRVEFD